MSQVQGEVTANPVLLGQHATDCAWNGRLLYETIMSARQSIVVPATAFGNSTGAEALDNLHQQVIEAGGATVERMADTVTDDADKLVGMAFAYKQQDEANAHDINVPERA